MSNILWLPIITALSIETHPVFDYNYTYTSGYGQRETTSGTPFYKRKIPEISTQLYFLNIPDWVISTNIKTGTFTDKMKIYPSLNLGFTYIFYKKDKLSISLSSNIIFGGNIKEKPCYDTMWKKFHCYYNSKPSEYFIYSYDQINIMNKRKFVEVNKININFNWTF